LRRIESNSTAEPFAIVYSRCAIVAEKAAHVGLTWRGLRPNSLRPAS